MNNSLNVYYQQENAQIRLKIKPAPRPLNYLASLLRPQVNCWHILMLRCKSALIFFQLTQLQRTCILKLGSWWVIDIHSIPNKCLAAPSWDRSLTPPPSCSAVGYFILLFTHIYRSPAAFINQGVPGIKKVEDPCFKLQVYNSLYSLTCLWPWLFPA